MVVRYGRLPSRRAWIETGTEVAEAYGYEVAFPRGGRGLKLVFRLEMPLNGLSRRLPSRRAWIETRRRVSCKYFHAVAFPRGGRGLKRDIRHAVHPRGCRLPSRRAWIETYKPGLEEIPIGSPSHAGGVD